MGWRRVLTIGILGLALLGTGSASALDEVPYGVAQEPWTEGMGNHRAIVRVEQKADAVLVKIPWRRRDLDPERKQIILVDSATSQRITNLARLRLDRFEGVLAFQPQTVPGDYFVYYVPFVPEPNWGNYNHDYLPPQETAAADWKTRLPADPEGLPRAAVVRLEARTEFDSFYPMEVVATPEETQAMLKRSAESAYLLFPEDRRFPIRMTDELPLRWVKSGPGKEFHGEVQRNEFYVFQVGVWAARTNLAGLDVEFKGEIARWLNCFNTGGTNWDGKPFRKTVNVPQGRVQALWLGVNVPHDAKPGEHRATVTIHPTNALPGVVELKLNVLPTELADHGDSEPWRLARLRWLDSTLGADDSVVSPYEPIQT
ncbi:MAG TPA: glycoside hydrolase domain-containing protein, partial [Verrucomicrobiae bacterium]